MKSQHFLRKMWFLSKRRMICKQFISFQFNSFLLLHWKIKELFECLKEAKDGFRRYLIVTIKSDRRKTFGSTVLVSNVFLTLGDKNSSKTRQDQVRDFTFGKYTHICSFRKYTFQYRGSLNFADVSIFLQKISFFWPQIVLLHKAIL